MILQNYELTWLNENFETNLHQPCGLLIMWKEKKICTVNSKMWTFLKLVLKWRKNSDSYKIIHVVQWTSKKANCWKENFDETVEIWNWYWSEGKMITLKKFETGIEVKEKW